jgi:hypothetical protein
MGVSVGTVKSTTSRALAKLRDTSGLRDDPARDPSDRSARMSPIDDELRAALQGRAQALAPSPDPLAGIERRARRIQRGRVGAAVAGSVLAVGLVAAVVPAVQSATSAPPDVPRFASTAPSTKPTLAGSQYVLDPAQPWTYRGTPLDQLGAGTVETIEREYTLRHPNALVTLTPLFGQVYEPSQRVELVFLADVDGEKRWGVAQGTEAGPEFLWDEPLPEPALALAAALPGDEVPRLLVVAAPDAGAVEYGPNDASEYDPMTQVAPGVAVTPLDGDARTDSYRVLVGAEEVARADAPGLQDRTPEGADEPQPAAALDPDAPWEVRGDASLVTDDQLQALGADWAQRHGVATDQVRVTPLYVQRSPLSGDVEVVYLVRFRDNPWMWGVSSLAEGGWSWYADNELAAGTTALAAALPGDASSERLLVVAAPSVGGAVYAADGKTYTPMTDQEPGVFLTPIAPGDRDDRFKVLDGDGDLDRPVFEGAAPEYQNAG